MTYYARLLAGAGFSATALGLLTIPVVAHAQEAEAAGDTDTDIGSDTATSSANIYVPADFERYAARNALDMLGQVPGFTIRDEGGGRGLGQANANVLIDGERVSSKSSGLFDQLRRIGTDRVERIEIVDGATMGIPGLSGQVANVITRPSNFSGQFEYRAMFRPKYAEPSFFGGEISLSGSGESYEWTLAYSHGVGRGAAAGGEAYFSDAAGNITENTIADINFVADFPQLSGNGKWTSPGGTVINANASYSRRYINFSNDELRTPVDGSLAIFRDFDNRRRGYGYEVGGDIDFALVGGRMKLIGLERYNYNNARADSVNVPQDGSLETGSRFANISGSGERIARAEYSWDMLGGDWQWDAEAAFNRLDRTATLFDLDPSGEFVEIPFPNGTGGVREDRYETILTHSRSLAEGLTLQVGAGGEYSTLTQIGAGGLTRSFWRPKGSLTLAWAASDGLDISLELARDVGQLSFGDFLASVSLAQNNLNAGNTQLVPPQSWDAELEVKKDLGAWGSTTVRLIGNWYEDRIELIPAAGGFETRGNIPSARYLAFDWRTTLELSQIGFNGAKLDASFTYRDTALEDPLTGETRAFDAQQDVYAEVSLRHDVPGSDWAWGVGIQYNHTLPFYRLGEFGRDDEGPVYTYGFVEHKDVFGMTAQINVFNITNGRARYERTVFDGPRDSSPILFREYRNLSVQPIIRFQLTGDF